MLVKIEARILIFPSTDFHFPSTSVPPGTFLGSATLWGNATGKFSTAIRINPTIDTFDDLCQLTEVQFISFQFRSVRHYSYT